MPSRAELNARAAVVGLDPSTIANDSKLEQKVLYLETNATALTGTIATTTLTTDTTTVNDGEVVVLGNKTYEFKTALSEAVATTTLTTTNTFSDGETITVAGRQYIMRTALNAAAMDEVLIGASASASLDNLKTTINGTGQGSTTNNQTRIHATVTAGTKTSSSLVIQAKNVGTLANNYVTLQTCANATFTGSTMSGGAESVANEVLIGADAAHNLSNLATAITDSGTRGVNYSSKTAAHREVTTSTLTGTTLLLNARNFAVGNGSIATTTTAGHLSFTGSAMASGAAKVVTAPSTNFKISGGVDHL